MKTLSLRSLTSKLLRIEPVLRHNRYYKVFLWGKWALSVLVVQTPIWQVATRGDSGYRWIAVHKFVIHLRPGWFLPF